MTNILYDDIILTMIVFKNSTTDMQSIAFISSGLISISDNGRKRLKNIAQTLIAIQNRPGFPVSDKIHQEIIWDITKEQYSRPDSSNTKYKGV